MKQKRLPTDFNIPKFLAFTFLAIASLFWLNGCTTKALQIAEEKASTKNAEYWKIKGVVSAVKHLNGDISVCVELNDLGETEGLQRITAPIFITC